jgi:hypothetical protein
VIVSARPYWLEKPESVNVTEGDNATINCMAAGIPSPTVSWFINGRNQRKGSQINHSTIFL